MSFKEYENNIHRIAADTFLTSVTFGEASKTAVGLLAGQHKQVAL